MTEMNGSSFRGVMVYSENPSLLLELLAAGRGLADKLGAPLSAVLIGGEVGGERREEAIRHGADRVYVLENPRLADFNAETYKAALLRVVEAEPPEVLLIGGTKRGKELAPRVAAALETGCMTDCISLEVDEEGRLVGRRLTYGGSTVAEEVCLRKPQMATIPPRVYERPEPAERRGEVVALEVEVPEPRVRVVERKEKRRAGFRIEDAPVIVAGGRGIKKREDLKLLEELAEVLGARVGCTRPLAADYHWLEEWIGLSGHKVKPDLYIACGISGTIQHVAGIRDAKVIVAINSDEEAPIFNIADYGIVGDLYKVVPALTKALKEKLGK
ncbi:electron transfer flavoprotein subunit alpha/FixB family protein [Candidatus Bathyarchaeota archaeon]|nr:MAG: electron transfer flavoprotein subunit alpha/FixB family protein [Candidatus Bathyarchaeota archaeon]